MKLLHFLYETPYLEQQLSETSGTGGFEIFRNIHRYVPVQEPIHIKMLTYLKKRFETVQSTVTADEIAVALTAPGEPSGSDQQNVLSLLFQLFRFPMLKAYTAPVLCTGITDRPQVSALARYDAQTSVSVTATLSHDKFRFQSLSQRAFLQLLDGSRTHAELAEAVRLLVADKSMTLQDPAGTPDEAIRKFVDENLQLLAQSQMLCA